MLAKNNQKKNIYTSESWGNLSIVLTIISIIAWIIWLVNNWNGLYDYGWGKPGLYEKWSGIINYYLFFGGFAAIISTPAGIVGLFSKKPEIATASLILKVLMLVTLIALHIPDLKQLDVVILGPIIFCIVFAMIIAAIRRKTKKPLQKSPKTGTN